MAASIAISVRRQLRKSCGSCEAGQSRANEVPTLERLASLFPRGIQLWGGVLEIEGVSGCRIVMVVEPCIIYRVGHEVIIRWLSIENSWQTRLM